MSLREAGLMWELGRRVTKAWKKLVIWPVGRPIVAWRARKWTRKH